MILSLAAWALEHRTTMGWPPLGEDDKAECLRLARSGLQHSAGDPRVMVHCGMALLQTGKDYDGGMAVLLPLPPIPMIFASRHAPASRPCTAAISMTRSSVCTAP